MDEYVNRKKLEEAFDNADTDVCESDMDGYSDWGFGRENVRDVIRSVPAADVAPVRHGEWEIVVGSNGKEYMVCTCCRVSQDLTGVFTYCPNCGAKMDGKGEDA